MPPYLTPTTEAALINAASSMTVEFMRQMQDFSSRTPEKRNDYLNEKFISYYFRNILAALRQNYIDDLRDVISP